MKKALILVDYINEICHKDGAFGCFPMLEANQAIAKLNRLLKYARENSWLVVWIIVGFDESYPEASPYSPLFTRAKEFQKFQRGSWGTEILADLDYQTGELIICKNAINPFHATNLDHVLRVNGIGELYISGVSTEVAIQSCTRDAHDRGYKVNVIADCCASSRPQFHGVSLEMLSYIANIVQSDSLVP